MMRINYRQPWLHRRIIINIIINISSSSSGSSSRTTAAES